jgi:hypothetical protein
MRHLTPAQAVDALRRGKPVEQLLPSEPREGHRTVRWLSVNPVRGDGFVLTAHYVYDDGIPDVYESTPVDPEEYLGEGVDVGRHAEAEDALEAAGDRGALSERWVNFGIVADEYADRRVS